MARQPLVDRTRKTAFASTFGTIHDAKFAIPQPVGASIPPAPGYTLASLDPGSMNIGGAVRDRFLGEDAFRPQAYAGPVIDRTRKGDYGVARDGDRRVARKGDRLQVKPAVAVAHVDEQQLPRPSIAQQQQSGEPAAAAPPTEVAQAAAPLPPSRRPRRPCKPKRPRNRAPSRRPSRRLPSPPPRRPCNRSQSRQRPPPLPPRRPHKRKRPRNRQPSRRPRSRPTSQPPRRRPPSPPLCRRCNRSRPRSRPPLLPPRRRRRRSRARARADTWSRAPAIIAPSTSLVEPSGREVRASRARPAARRRGRGSGERRRRTAGRVPIRDRPSIEQADVESVAARGTALFQHRSHGAKVRRDRAVGAGRGAETRDGDIAAAKAERQARRAAAAGLAARRGRGRRRAGRARGPAAVAPGPGVVIKDGVSGGQTVAPKGEVTGADKRPMTPAERLGLDERAAPNRRNAWPRRSISKRAANMCAARWRWPRWCSTASSPANIRPRSAAWSTRTPTAISPASSPSPATAFPTSCASPTCGSGRKTIAAEMLDGKLWLPEVGKATHYHAYWVRPGWVREMTKLHKARRPYLLPAAQVGRRRRSAGMGRPGIDRGSRQEARRSREEIVAGWFAAARMPATGAVASFARNPNISTVKLPLIPRRKTVVLRRPRVVSKDGRPRSAFVHASRRRAARGPARKKKVA